MNWQGDVFWRTAAMGQETAFVIHPDNRLEPLPRPPAQCLDEAAGLAAAIGLTWCLPMLPRSTSHAQQPLSAGYAEMLKQKAKEHGDDPVIIINTSLAPCSSATLRWSPAVR